MLSVKTWGKLFKICIICQLGSHYVNISRAQKAMLYFSNFFLYLIDFIHEFHIQIINFVHRHKNRLFFNSQ